MSEGAVIDRPRSAAPAAEGAPGAGRRILIVVSVVNLAGAQIAALRLARGLADRGWRPKVVFLYERDPIAEPAFPFEVLLRKASPGPAGYLRIARDLAARVRRERPDVVLTFLPLANTLGQLSARLAGVRGRVVTHRIPVNTAGALLRRVDTLSAWAGLYTGVVAVSEGVRKTCGHYPGWLRERTAVVHNGLLDWAPSNLSPAEARQKFGVAAGDFVLAAVGRLAEQKNYPLMLDVMERLDGATLLVAGDGPLRAALEERIAARRLGEKVRLLGRMAQAEIRDLLAAADAFIQTSIFEGQSNAVLEALSAGLPVIAHDIPEQRETIADADGAVAGALVPLDDVEAWTEAVEKLRADPSAAAEARAVAARRAERFSFSRMIDGFERELLLSLRR